jgi:heparinase II/III-like protein
MKISIRFILISCFLFIGVHAVGDDGSIESVCADFPDRVQYLFQAVDLDRPGLEAVKRAASDADWPRACEALLAYYRDGDSAAWLRRATSAASDAVDDSAEPILDDTFTFYTLTDRVPRMETGGLDWHYRGPNDDREWAWALNRHFHMKTLVEAYFATGNARYARTFDAHLRDWVSANPYPGKKSSTGPWRGLEAHFRVRNWAEGFYALQDEAALTPAARILLLSSIPEHAHYLRNYHAPTSNWIAMEMYALATAAVCWPEFRDADEWLDYAVEQMNREVTAQVYPDGVQHELTSHYHTVTLANFQRFRDLMTHTERELPSAFHKTLDGMWNYLAYAMRPDGYGPMNNDSDRDNNRARVQEKAAEMDRSDWTYIATNGAEGSRPAGPASVGFPWAGQLVMRSGYEADANWAFFDFGPLGSGHWHRDKLHLSVMAHGRDVLVDSGRYTYMDGPWRRYFTGSAAHNVVLVDGHGQRDYTRVGDASLDSHYDISDGYDFAWGAIDAGYVDVAGEAIHTRAVYHRRGQYWLVLDRFETDRPREIQTLWHFHPSCTVVVEGSQAVSTDADVGNVRIIPASGPDWTVELVEGREPPDAQGWWSVKYNKKKPSPVAVYSTEVETETVFAWLLLPGSGKPPEAAAHLSSEGKRVNIHVSAPNLNETVSFVFDESGRVGLDQSVTKTTEKE